jgi:hypothetical protein
MNDPLLAFVVFRNNIALPHGLMRKGSHGRNKNKYINAIILQKIYSNIKIYYRIFWPDLRIF